jgi:hypothetical protein
MIGGAASTEDKRRRRRGLAVDDATRGVLGLDGIGRRSQNLAGWG